MVRPTQHTPHRTRLMSPSFLTMLQHWLKRTSGLNACQAWQPGKQRQPAPSQPDVAFFGAIFTADGACSCSHIKQASTRQMNKGQASTGQVINGQLSNGQGSNGQASRGQQAWMTCCSCLNMSSSFLKRSFSFWSSRASAVVSSFTTACIMHYHFKLQNSSTAPLQSCRLSASYMQLTEALLARMESGPWILGRKGSKDMDIGQKGSNRHGHMCRRFPGHQTER